jgi:hypothetical protein
MFIMYLAENISIMNWMFSGGSFTYDYKLQRSVFTGCCLMNVLFRKKCGYRNDVHTCFYFDTDDYNY